MKPFATGVILAGGESTRFYPFTDKNLFNFAGKPLLLHQVEKLLSYFGDIFVVANAKNFAFIQKTISNYKNITVVSQKGQGQAAALLSLANQVRGEALIINNCDVFDERVIFEKLAEMKKTYRLILTAKEMSAYFPGGYLRLSGEKLVKLIEKPRPEERPSNWVRLVVDYFDNLGEFLTLMEKLPTPHKDGHYEEALNRYLTEVKSSYVKYEDYWHALKYPWHVLSVKDFFLKNLKSHRGAGVKVHETAMVEGEVYLDDGVVLHEYAKVVGPCYIGPATVIGNYTLTRESMIGVNCIIGGYSEVTRSYLGDRVYLHRNYVGDSVLANDILCGAEMLCANFRFDQKPIFVGVGGEKINTGLTKLGALIGAGAKIGVNTSLMPGVTIAAGAVVMPHSFINQDIK